MVEGDAVTEHQLERVGLRWFVPASGEVKKRRSEAQCGCLSYV